MRSADYPVGLTKCREDMRALGIGQGLHARRLGSRGYTNQCERGLSQVLRRFPAQHRAGRQNDTALNDILKLPDIAGPVMRPGTLTGVAPIVFAVMSGVRSALPGG